MPASLILLSYHLLQVFNLNGIFASFIKLTLQWWCKVLIFISKVIIFSSILVTTFSFFL